MEKLPGAPVTLPAVIPFVGIEIIEVYEEYDGPRLFACRSLSDQLFIANWVEESENSDFWLYVPVSRHRFASIRSGLLDLRRAFADPESGLYVVGIPYGVNGDEASVQLRRADEVSIDWFPEADEFLTLSTETLPAMPSATTLKRLATQESRGRVLLKLEIPGITRSEAPSRIIGELLQTTQTLYDTVGLGILQPRGDQSKAGRLPVEVTAQTSTDVLSLSAASFVIELGSSMADDLFGGSIFSQVSQRILGLLDFRLDQDALTKQLQEVRPRGANSFRNFIRLLAKTGADFRFATASAQVEFQTRNLSHDALVTLRAILDSSVPDEIHELRGPMSLVAFDVDSKRFGLRDESSEQRYEGRVAERAVPQVDHATVNEVYDVVVTEYGRVDGATGERKADYVLEQLSSLSDDVATSSVSRTVLQRDN